MKLIVLGVILVVLISLGVVSCGGHRRGWPDNKTDYVVKKLSRELDLTEEQQTQVRRLADETWADMEGRRTDWESKREDVKQLFLSEDLSAASVERFINENTPDHEEMRGLFAQRLSEFHAILTAEQREKLVEEMEKKWNRHGHRRWSRRR